MKDLSKVDMKDIAKEWEKELNGSISEPQPLESKTVLLQKPVRVVPGQR